MLPRLLRVLAARSGQIEIKAGTRVDRSDLAGIRALRGRVGKRLAVAVVLHTGALSFRFDDGTVVLPLDLLWSTMA